MNEASRVEEAGSNVPTLQFLFGTNQVKVQVTAVADSVEKVIEAAHCVLDDWVAAGGKDNIAKISDLGTVARAQQVLVPEDQPRGTVGIARDSDVNTINDIGSIVQLVPSEDLLAVSRIIVEELSRRSGPEYGDSTVAQLLQIDLEVRATPGSPRPSTVGDAITND